MSRLRFLLAFTMLLPWTVSAIPTYQAQYDTATNVLPRQTAHLGQALPDGGPAAAVDDHRAANLPRDVPLATREGGGLFNGNQETLESLAQSISATLENGNIRENNPGTMVLPRRTTKMTYLLQYHLSMDSLGHLSNWKVGVRGLAIRISGIGCL